MSELAEWEAFYLIVGAAAGVLIGLQFVVITLIVARPPQGAVQATAAFATPTIVHFCNVLVLSAVLCAPWHAVTAVAVSWGLVGAGGAWYSCIVARRMRTQSAYQPQFEDWATHFIAPLVAYVALAATAFAAAARLRETLFVVGAASLLLLFSAIHNAWDAAAYHVTVIMRNEKD